LVTKDGIRRAAGRIVIGVLVCIVMLSSWKSFVVSNRKTRVRHLSAQLTEINLA
jgi:hypothetical protein